MAIEFEIRGDEDLFRVIERIRAEAWQDDDQIVFVDWPRYKITIVGERFGGGVPTRIMPALLDVQRIIDRTYAKNVYGVEKPLTQEDRKKTEIIVHLKSGSTTFESEMSSIFNAMVSAVENMSGNESVIAILGVAAMYATSTIFKAYINTSAQKHKIEYRAKMNEEETERYRIFSELASQNAQVAKSLADVNAAQTALIKRLHEKDSILMNGEEIVTGEIGKIITRPERPPRVEEIIDSDFTILSVHSGDIRGGFRLWVREAGSEVGSKQSLKIFIPGDTLPPEQIDDLQNGEWRKTPIRMQINTARIGNRVVKATLISAGPPI